MAEDQLAHRPTSPLGHSKAVRDRLIASFAVALMLSVAWGPFCALANLLRADPPTVLFSLSRYLFLTAGVCVAMSVVALIAAVPMVALTVLLWKRFGGECQRWFLGLGLVPLGILTLCQLDLLAYATDIVDTPRATMFGMVIVVSLTYCIVAAYLKSPTMQIAAFPLASLYPLLFLVDLLSPFGMVLASLGLTWMCQRYSNPSAMKEVFVDGLGMMAFIAIPLAILLHLRIGHYVPALDVPYTLAFVGLLGLVVGVVLLARRSITSLRTRPRIAWIVCGLGLMMGGLYWSRYPPALPDHTAISDDRPNIVLIVWDTVRAQQLSAYGYHRKTTPVFDKLASEGVLFQRATANSCWTLPTHASMFTGLLPRTHAASNGGYAKLAKERKTIAEFLSEAGYETVGLSANHISAGRRTAISQGFQLFHEPRPSAETAAVPAQVLRMLFYPYDDGAMAIERALRRWLLSRREIDKPYFLFVNLFEPHDLYRARSDLVEMSPGITLAEARKWSKASDARRLVVGPGRKDDTERSWQGLRDLYDGEIRYVDHMTGNLLSLLRAAGEPASNSLLIVTSDHGENLGEHDLGDHIFSVHDTLLHVPLVLSWPGHISKGTRDHRRIATIDLFATIAEAAGLAEDVYASSASSSLLGMGEQSPSNARKTPVVAEAWPAPITLEQVVDKYKFATPQGRFNTALFAIYDGDWKYIRGSGQGREQLFNLGTDPKEEHDLSAQEPERCARMSDMLDKWLDETPNNMPTFADGYEKGPLER